MREKRKRTVSQPETWYWKWRTGYDSKTFLNACGSLLITTFFALYNGFLGVMHASPWHGSICVYYLLLAVLRFSILMMERHARRQENAEAERGRLKIYLVCAGLLLVLNLCLIGPISLMVRMQRPVNMTLIPAIAMAAYAFFKVSAASVHLARRKRSTNCLVRLLRTINFIDALVSIASLQNTLIMVVTTGEKRTLLPLTAASSGLIWLGIVCLSGLTLRWGIRRQKELNPDA